jgi:transcription termination factor Rho
MAVARGDDGSGNVGSTSTTSPAGNVTRRRMLRKPPAVTSEAPPPAPASAPPVPVPVPVIASPPSTATSTRLDDLYRLAMPKLFAYAEREGIAEHTGMNRGQLIMAVVRRQIERGVTVRGSGTLEVLPDGYGFLRSVAHNYLA